MFSNARAPPRVTLEASAALGARAANTYGTVANTYLTTMATAVSNTAAAVMAKDASMTQNMGAQYLSQVHAGATVASCFIDTTKDSDGGAWVEKMGSASLSLIHI